jgi:hypothetical protein
MFHAAGILVQGKQEATGICGAGKRVKTLLGLQCGDVKNKRNEGFLRLMLKGAFH